MKTSLPPKILGLMTLMVLSHVASATTVVTLGNSNPGFADGSKPGSAIVLAAGAGQPAPFNAFIGADGSANFSASWTFNYSVLSNVTDGTVAIGIYDGDSAALGNQVASFSLSSGGTSTDLTGGLNTVFEANGGAPTGIYNVYTLTLPSSTFASLASGNVSFALSLQNGLGVLGPAPFNGAELVFSTLNVTTQTPVPLPAASFLFLGGLSALFSMARRKATGVGH